jgi:hypothetical protein
LRTLLATPIADIVANDPANADTQSRAGRFGINDTDKFGCNFTSVMSFVEHHTGRNIADQMTWQCIAEQLQAKHRYFEQDGWSVNTSIDERMGKTSKWI